MLSLGSEFIVIQTLFNHTCIPSTDATCFDFSSIVNFDVFIDFEMEVLVLEYIRQYKHC